MSVRPVCVCVCVCACQFPSDSLIPVKTTDTKHSTRIHKSTPSFELKHQQSLGDQTFLLLDYKIQNDNHPEHPSNHSIATT